MPFHPLPKPFFRVPLQFVQLLRSNCVSSFAVGFQELRSVLSRCHLTDTITLDSVVEERGANWCVLCVTNRYSLHIHFLVMGSCTMGFCERFVGSDSLQVFVTSCSCRNVYTRVRCVSPILVSVVSFPGLLASASCCVLGVPCFITRNLCALTKQLHRWVVVLHLLRAPLLR